MSEQLSEKLINECAAVDFDELKLYAIVHGKRAVKPRWNNQYPFRHRPRPSSEAVCAVLWRGSQATYRLTDAGVLILQGYAYPFDPRQAPDLVHEPLTGHFWLVMKERFFGECTYVPFLNGRIVTDRQQWVKGECDVKPEPFEPGKARRRRPVL